MNIPISYDVAKWPPHYIMIITVEFILKNGVENI
jgi:hypothetical protein